MRLTINEKTENNLSNAEIRSSDIATLIRIFVNISSNMVTIAKGFIAFPDNRPRGHSLHQTDHGHKSSPTGSS